MFAKFRSRYLVTELLPLPRVFYIIIPLIEPPPPLLAHSGRRLSIYPAPRPHLSPCLRSVFLFAPLYFTFHQPASTNFDLKQRIHTPSAHACRAFLSSQVLLSLEFLCTDILFSVLGYWLRSAGPNARFRVSGLYGETATTSCSQGCNGPLSQRAPIFRSDIYDHVPSCSPAYLSLSANKSKGAGNSYQLAETWIAEGIPR